MILKSCVHTKIWEALKVLCIEQELNEVPDVEFERQLRIVEEYCEVKGEEWSLRIASISMKDEKLSSFNTYVTEFLELKAAWTARQCPPKRIMKQFLNGIQPGKLGTEMQLTMSDEDTLETLIGKVSRRLQDMRRTRRLFGVEIKTIERQAKEMKLSEVRDRSEDYDERRKQTLLRLQAVECFHCHEKGHYKSNCPKLEQGRPEEMKRTLRNGKNYGMLEDETHNWKIEVKINEHTEKALIDTGSKHSFISEGVAEELQREGTRLDWIDVDIRLADGSALPVKGKMRVRMEVRGQKITKQVLVSKIGERVIIGRDLLDEFPILTISPEHTADCWKLHPDIFQMLVRRWWLPSVDRFASFENKQVPNFNSVIDEIGTGGIDAFSQNWKCTWSYGNPPFKDAILTKVVEKIISERANFILITPNWMYKSWYKKAMRFSKDFLLLGRSDNLFFSKVKRYKESSGPPPFDVAAFMFEFGAIEEGAVWTPFAAVPSVPLSATNKHSITIDSIEEDEKAPWTPTSPEIVPEKLYEKEYSIDAQIEELELEAFYDDIIGKEAVGEETIIPENDDSNNPYDLSCSNFNAIYDYSSYTPTSYSKLNSAESDNFDWVPTSPSSKEHIDFHETSYPTIVKSEKVEDLESMVQKRNELRVSCKRTRQQLMDECYDDEDKEEEEQDPRIIYQQKKRFKMKGVEVSKQEKEIEILNKKIDKEFEGKVAWVVVERSDRLWFGIEGIENKEVQSLSSENSPATKIQRPETVQEIAGKAGKERREIGREEKRVCQPSFLMVITEELPEYLRGGEKETDDVELGKRAKEVDEMLHVEESQVTDAIEEMLSRTQPALRKGIEETVETFLEIFKPLSEEPSEAEPFSIELEPQVTPKWQKVRRLSPEKALFVKEEVERLIDRNIIVVSRSPWASPIVVVPKGTTYRLCIDYKLLNSVTVKDQTPIPTIQDLFDQLEGKKYFATIDLAQGYYQIAMQEDSQLYTAFVTPHGLYQFKRMPFGLANAPAAFVRIMRKVLAGLLDIHCLLYFDDICVFGSTEEELRENLRLVFERLQLWKMKINTKKTKLGVREVKYLGFKINSKGREIDMERVAAI
ncbi:MAG: reverse transcriptase domain-containing protein, partial [Pseudomonadota bacterium]